MKPRVLLSIAAAAVCLAVAAGANAERLRVQVNDAPVRDGKGPFAKIVAKLGLGDEVEAVAEKVSKGQPGLYAVKQGPAGALNGYMTAASLVPASKAVSTGKGLSKGADDPEVQNSVRGWDDVHKSSGGGRDFEAVRWIEKVSRSKADQTTGESVEFRKGGKLGEFSKGGSQ
jgi:hypothetical protein